MSMYILQKIFILLISVYAMINTTVNKDKLILIRVTELEKNALKQRASEYHLTLSRYLILIGLRGRIR
jgi:predicted DNA binding CopG/RHH family protein